MGHHNNDVRGERRKATQGEKSVKSRNINRKKLSKVKQETVEILPSTLPKLCNILRSIQTSKRSAYFLFYFIFFP